MNRPFNVLINSNAGLNDVLSNLLRVYFFFNELRDNCIISLYSPQYSADNLEECLDFNDRIKLVSKIDATSKQYDYITGLCTGHETVKYTTNQINEVFSIKKSIINSVENYKGYIGIHFRHMGTEFTPEKATDEFLRFKNLFLNLYTPDNKYLIISDCAKWSTEFVNKDNITYLVPNEDINPLKNNISGKRNEHLKLSLQQICAAATCDVVYKTMGNFLNLTRCINDKVTFKPL